MGKAMHDLLLGAGHLIVETDAGVQEPPYREPRVPALLLRWLPATAWARLPDRLQRLLLARATRRAQLDHAWRVANWWAQGKPRATTRTYIPRAYISTDGIQENTTETGVKEYTFSINMVPEIDKDIWKGLFG